MLALLWGCRGVLVEDPVAVSGAVAAWLSFCVGSRAVPGVHDRDPHPRATQKVSVCGFGGGQGQGPQGCMPAKVGSLQGGHLWALKQQHLLQDVG